MTELSRKAAAIRTTVLSVLSGFLEPASTTEVIDRVVTKIEQGDVRGVQIVDRHEVRAALEGLLALGKLVRHHQAGEVEHSRGRRSGRRHSRAVRGTVSWSIAGNAR